MKYLQLKKMLISAFAFLALILGACGGESSSTADSGQTFDLTILQTTTEGTVYASQMTGYDTDGYLYTGSMSITNQAQTMVDGILVTPRDLFIFLDGGDRTATVAKTSNIDTDGNLISVVTQSYTCTPVTPDKMPEAAKIGDSGVLSSLTCSNNNTQERSWMVEDAGNESINFILRITVKDALNTTTSIIDYTYTLDNNGALVAYKRVVNRQSDGYIQTAESL